MPAKLPIAVVQARGKKHLSKEEIRTRSEQEIKALDGDIVAPDILTSKQKQEFYKIADQLKRLKILGETDVDALGRYILSNDMYTTATKKLRTSEVKNDPYLFDMWSKIQERYFKMVRVSANDLGLSISARCKLVIPTLPDEETPKTNKFAKFERGDDDDRSIDA